MLGRPLQESIKTFSAMAGQVFKKRLPSSIPLLSHAAESLVSYFTDGLYSAGNVDAVLRDWITNKSILDCSHATSTGTKIGLPVATVSDHPSCRLFTNYNGIGERDSDQGKPDSRAWEPRLAESPSENAIIRPKDGFGNVPLWEM